jgi:hypothetical protein
MDRIRVLGLSKGVVAISNLFRLLSLIWYSFWQNIKQEIAKTNKKQFLKLKIKNLLASHPERFLNLYSRF